MTDTLFDLPAGPPKDDLSADRRRTVRQREAIRLGGHPLALVFPTIRLHPDAPRPLDGPGGHEPGPRCGGCLHRRLYSGNGNRAFPKCFAGTPRQTGSVPPAPPRVSCSGATDVRAWWPACTDFTPTP